MSELPTTPMTRTLAHEIEAIRGNWLWFVILGIALIVLGMVALGTPVIATHAIVMVLGSLFLASGLFEILGAFWARKWSGTLIVLLSGILTAVLGFILLEHSIVGALALTVLILSFLLVSGIFKVAAALSHRVGAWLWLVFSGVVDVLLALLIWKGLPETSLIVVGILVGINMIVRGLTWIMIGLSIRSLVSVVTTPEPAPEPAPATPVV